MGLVQKYLSGIFQELGDFVFVTDPEGNILDYNIAGQRLLGFSRDEVLNHPLTYLWINDKECHETLSWVLGEASVYVSNLEVWFRRKNGEELDLSLTLSKLRNSDGEVIGAIGVGRDITEKKKIEAAFRTIHQELENFIYTISHDLKTPIVSIEGYTSLLKQDFKDQLDKRGLHYLERINWNVRKMGVLLKDLLELSRSGRVIGKLAEVDAGEVISSVINEMLPIIERNRITLVIAKSFPRVWTDRERLTEVFENLLSNAVKFIGDQRDPSIEVGYKDRDGYQEFFVKDNGIGIDPQYHEKIFGIFQRLEELPADGTGVGLTIVKRIIESHGGNIRVESKRGQGATFYFTIPRK